MGGQNGKVNGGRGSELESKRGKGLKTGMQMGKGAQNGNAIGEGGQDGKQLMGCLGADIFLSTPDSDEIANDL